MATSNSLNATPTPWGDSLRVLGEEMAKLKLLITNMRASEGEAAVNIELTPAALADVALAKAALATYIHHTKNIIRVIKERNRRLAINLQLKQLKKNKTPKNVRMIRRLEFALGDGARLQRGGAQLNREEPEDHFDTNIRTMADLESFVNAMFETIMDLQKRAMKGVQQLSDLHEMEGKMTRRSQASVWIRNSRLRTSILSRLRRR